ncbi:MAG: C2 family cysteine protease, partial [Rhodanobacter sp.]
STDEDGNTTKTVFNALGAAVETIDGTGAISYVGYDALGNKVAAQDGNGNITFTNVDALGRTVQAGEFVLATGGASRQLVWQQAYVLDQNGNRLISYDGIGSAYLQTGDTTDAALHASYDGYDSQGHVLWSQDAAQRAASTSDIHGLGNYGSGSWTQTPPNANFQQGAEGWNVGPGWTFGDFGGNNGPYGDWSLSFGGYTPTGSSSIFSKDLVPVSPGQTITASGYFIANGVHGGGNAQIAWYDANGNLISISSDSGDTVSAHRGAGYSSVTGSAPPGAVFAALGVGAINYNIGSATVYASGISWDYVPPADITSVGTGNGGAVVILPSGSFTVQPTNGDFEAGDTGWDKGAGWSIAKSTNSMDTSWTGSYNGVGPGVMVNQDRVPVVPGQSISAGVMVSLYLAPDGAQASGAVAIQWFDASGNLISTSVGSVVYSDHKGAWKPSSLTAIAPPGAAFAALAVAGNTNGIGGVGVDGAHWNYQYTPQVPTGVVQDTYVYNADGDLISESTADGDTESWQYNQYGQAITHTDLSGATYNYTYDPNTGLETNESDDWSPTAQGQTAPGYVTGPISTPNSEALTYEADGQIATESFSDGSSYSYSYDANGNLTREEDITRDGNNNLVHTVTQTSYDSHNRISSVVETNEVTGVVMLNESFSYDAAGNRREVSATSDGTTQNAWYTYDGDNRVQVSDGSLVNGQIVVTDAANSYEQLYDANGNVVNQVTVSAASDTLVQHNVYNQNNELIEANYAVDTTTGGASRGVQETISYDADGHALITDQYYALGTTLGGLPPGKVNPDDSEDDEGDTGVDVGGELDNATIDFYDAVGRLAEEQTFGNPTNWNGAPDTPPATPPTPNSTTYGNLTMQSEVVYQGPNGTSGYDADGDVVAYQYRDNTGRIDQYTVTYLRKDTYLQSVTSGINVSDTPNVQPATDQTIYDTRGNEVALEQHTEDPYGALADTIHVFAYNGDGEIIERQDGTGTATGGTTLNQGSDPATQVQNYTYVNGQQLAHFDNAGTLDVLDEVTAFSSNNDSPNSYVVQAGDTLESIAQSEYGDANLWYVLAQANGLSSDTDLVLGQRLEIPTVTTNSNSATTFKPYDPSNITGSTTPNLPTIAPPPPPQGSGGCSVAEILVIVVTVVVTIVTYGATTDLLAGELGTFGTAVAAGAVAGAAGSIAGQLTGEATGIQQGFNWGQVLEGAIGGAIGGGVSSELSSLASTTDTGTSLLASDTSANGLNWLGDAIQGGATYAGNDLAAQITDQPAHFSWAGFVASSLSSVASGELGPTSDESQMGQTTGNYFDDLGARAVGDIVDREASLALGDQHVQSWAQVGEDVAGYAIAQPIGNALAGSAKSAIDAYKQQQAASQAAASIINDPYNPQALSAYSNLYDGTGTGTYSLVGSTGTGAQGSFGESSPNDGSTASYSATGNVPLTPLEDFQFAPQSAPASTLLNESQGEGSSGQGNLPSQYSAAGYANYLSLDPNLNEDLNLFDAGQQLSGATLNNNDQSEQSLILDTVTPLQDNSAQLNQVSSGAPFADGVVVGDGSSTGDSIDSASSGTQESSGASNSSGSFVPQYPLSGIGGSSQFGTGLGGLSLGGFNLTGLMSGAPQGYSGSSLGIFGSGTNSANSSSNDPLIESAYAYAQQKTETDEFNGTSAALYTLYGPGGMPAPSAVVQGQNGDCYLMSSIYSVALDQPQVIQNDIAPHMGADGTWDGTFDVTFPGTGQVENVGSTPLQNVKSVTDSSGATTSTTQYGVQNDGSNAYVTVLENAWAQAYGGWSGINSGLPENALYALTGQINTVTISGTSNYQWGPLSPSYQPADPRTGPSGQSLNAGYNLSSLASSLNSGAEEVFATIPTPGATVESVLDSNLVSGHAYAVTGFETDNNGNVTGIDLANPWGRVVTLQPGQAGNSTNSQIIIQPTVTLTPAQIGKYMSSITVSKH